jgi:hypothetical protein
MTDIYDSKAFLAFLLVMCLVLSVILVTTEGNKYIVMELINSLIVLFLAGQCLFYSDKPNRVADEVVYGMGILLLGGVSMFRFMFLDKHVEEKIYPYTFMASGLFVIAWLLKSVYDERKVVRSYGGVRHSTMYHKRDANGVRD